MCVYEICIEWEQASFDKSVKMLKRLGDERRSKRVFDRRLK